MNLNPAQLNQLSDVFQNLSNAARQAGSAKGVAASTSAQYFNQLLSQMSQNLQVHGSTSGSTPKAQNASNTLTALLGKFI
ncbi:MAG TPA: hypothetical protein VK604_00815 [Bryobacteraceae bacterium]|nr:hypothetical protein [Bryobacteraceae bacterium]